MSEHTVPLHLVPPTPETPLDRAAAAARVRHYRLNGVEEIEPGLFAPIVSGASDDRPDVEHMEAADLVAGALTVLEQLGSDDFAHGGDRSARIMLTRALDRLGADVQTLGLVEEYPAAFDELELVPCSDGSCSATFFFVPDRGERAPFCTDHADKRYGRIDPRSSR